jgi:proteasome lid subunit RPN8/RPN11
LWILSSTDEAVAILRVAGFKNIPRKEKKTHQNLPVTGIKRAVLRLMLEASRESFPNEFAGQLRAQDGVIFELTMLPGTMQGRTSALVNLWMLPIDYTVVGSVHSHPSGNFSPSEEDRNFFRKFGSVHIITGRPYTVRTWQAYDDSGEPMRLDIVE